MNTIYITEIKDGGDYTETFVNETLEGAEEDLLKALRRTWDEEYVVSESEIKNMFKNVDLQAGSNKPLIEFRMEWRCDADLSGSVTVRKVEIGN